MHVSWTCVTCISLKAFGKRQPVMPNDPCVDPRNVFFGQVPSAEALDHFSLSPIISETMHAL